MAEEISPAEYLEQRFDAGRLHRDCIARSIIDILEDHEPTCYYCRLGLAGDGMWWKPPAANWYQGVPDDFMDEWLLYDPATVPEPASQFALGPEYPTGHHG